VLCLIDVIDVIPDTGQPDHLQLVGKINFNLLIRPEPKVGFIHQWCRVVLLNSIL
jgi:hypothetical protein